MKSPCVQLGSAICARSFIIAMFSAILILPQRSNAVNIAMPYTQSTGKLFPYLAANGLYGYADSEMNIVITPQYQKAEAFTKTGYAIVQHGNSKYGVINAKNQLVLPMKYERIYLLETENYTIATTHLRYKRNARFWDWKLLPGFSIIGGGSSDNRLFDTQVIRTQKKLSVLENGKTIISKRMGKEMDYANDMSISHAGPNIVLVNQKLLQINKNSVKQLANGVFGKLDDGNYLRMKDKYYQIISPFGKAKNNGEYRKAAHLKFTVEREPVIIALEDESSYYHKTATVFIDQRGKQYIYPDISKAFPEKIEAHPSDSVHATNLLKSANVISSIPGSDRFLIRSFHKGRFSHQMLDLYGNWHEDFENYAHLHVVYPSGTIAWPPVSSILPPDHVPMGWKTIGYSEALRDSAWYIINIRHPESKEERAGLWDAHQKQWVWSPKYYSIAALDLDRQYWRFRDTKEGKCGLYHLRQQKTLLPPRYHDMGRDGMVVKYENGKHLRYYLDWETLKEFREKH